METDNYIHLYRLVNTTKERTERLCGDTGNDGTARHYRTGTRAYDKPGATSCPDCTELAPIYISFEPFRNL